MWKGEWPGLANMACWLVSPSYPQEKALLEGAAATLQDCWGIALLGAEIQPQPGAAFLNSFPKRLTTLQEALSFPLPALLIAARGGYGAYEAALALDRWLEDNRPKTLKALMGYSDISALHLLWRKHALGPSFMGPHSGGLSRANDPFSLAAIERLLQPGPLGVDMAGQWLVRPKGAVEGVAMGGNLTVLAATLGGPLWQCLPENILLFLEDIDEEPYQLDRSLLALQGAGVLQKVSALVLGDFTNCEKPEGKFGPSFEEVFDYRLRPMGVPIFKTSHFGHGDHQGLAPLGINVQLTGTSTGLTMIEH